MDQFLNKTEKIGIIGLGYVGLPLALAMSRCFKVVGFDINADRIAMMNQSQDPSNELPPHAFTGRDIVFTHQVEDLKSCRFYIVAVPTPIDEHKVPDLKYLRNASSLLGDIINEGDCVVYESTVYPGCTEEDCIPIIEKISGLKAGDDFSYGYSPERVNPGDPVHTIEKITKVVSGNSAESTDLIGDIYEKVITAGVFRAGSVKIAEAAKVIENAQRDLNIAFMNELSIIFDKMDIPTSEVLAAAGTKWNFLNFKPGLVGGHCIGVDPYYLTYKSEQVGYKPQVILSGRSINDGMPSYVAKRLIQKLISHGKNPGESRVLVKGLTFKENVSDTRNSKVVPMIKELAAYGVTTDVYDPEANESDARNHYGIELTHAVEHTYDALVLAVPHKIFLDVPIEEQLRPLKKGGIFIDLKSAIGPVEGYDYWSL